MAAYFKQEGNFLDYTPSGAKAAGDVVLLNDTVGIVPRDLAANEKGSIAVGGVWSDVPKKTGATWSVGQALYWVAADSAFGTSASGNKRAGIAAEAAESGATTGTILLLPPGV